MEDQKKSPFEYSIEELDKELIARSIQDPDETKFNFRDKEGTPWRNAVMSRTKEIYRTPPPLNKGLTHINTCDLSRVLMFKSNSLSQDFTRGNGLVELSNENDIMDNQARKNARCVAAICLKDNLVTTNLNIHKLEVKNYGKTFNLDTNESFHEECICSGPMGNGFLVKEDVIATAGPFPADANVNDLRFIFGYKMADTSTPVTEFPGDNIYSGRKIIQREDYNINNHAGWVLIQLDREVQGCEVPLFTSEEIYPDQMIYTMGYPLGLPLKYASGPSVLEKITETFFNLDLNLYSGYPGAPIFDINTNEIIGMVLEEADPNFRWTGKGWIAIQNPDVANVVKCIKISAIRLSL